MNIPIEVSPDQAEIDAAIAKVKGEGGGTVYLDPSRRYRLSRTLHVPEGVVLAGGRPATATEQ